MTNTRPITNADIDSLYEISLLTGDKGNDASSLYLDPKMMGHIYAAPYACLSPQTCFIAEQNDRIVGFIVGTHNTEAFEQSLEKEWWPSLRKIYPKPDDTQKSNWTADQKRAALIHSPERTPKQITTAYPAHLHMNLSPEAQNKGLGRILLGLWIDDAKSSGVSNVFIGSNRDNAKAIKFWQNNQFGNIDHLMAPDTPRTSYFGRNIE